MSITPTIEADFRRTVGDQVTIVPEGIDRYRVRTPFRLDDGDHIVVVLQQETPDRWRLTDEGNTFMKLTYRIEEQELRQGNRAELIDTALTSYHVEDRDGELVVQVPNAQFGDALYSLVQAILRISDVEYLTRERAKTTFFEDVRTLMRKTIATERISEKWHHPTKDPNEHYVVDYYVNGSSRPLLVFALQGDEQVRDATIIIRQFESWNEPISFVRDIRGAGEDRSESAGAVQRRLRETVLQRPNRERAPRAIPAQHGRPDSRAMILYSL